MNAYHPDDSGMITRDMARRQEEERRRRAGGGNRGNGAGGGLLAPFLPGDKALLAEQLAMGFGGGQQDYMKQLGQMYQPMRMGFNFGAGMGNGMGFGSGGPRAIHPTGIKPQSSSYSYSVG
jgi:hypothetical protein